MTKRRALLRVLSQNRDSARVFHYVTDSYSHIIVAPVYGTYGNLPSCSPLPQIIETEVFAAVPQNLRKSDVPAERIAAGGGGVPGGSFLEGPSFDRAGNLYVVDIPYRRIFASRRRASSMSWRNTTASPTVCASIKTGAFSSPIIKSGSCCSIRRRGAITPLRHALPSRALQRRQRSHVCVQRRSVFHRPGPERHGRPDRPRVSLYDGRSSAKSRRLPAESERARARREGRHASSPRRARMQCGAFRWRPTARSRAWACTSRCPAAAALMA